MSADYDRQGVRSQLVHGPRYQCRDFVCEDAIAQKRGVRKCIEELLHVESNYGVATCSEALGEPLVRFPEPEVIPQKKEAGLTVYEGSLARIEIQRLLEKVGVARNVGRVRG